MRVLTINLQLKNEQTREGDKVITNNSSTSQSLFLQDSGIFRSLALAAELNA